MLHKGNELRMNICTIVVHSSIRRQMHFLNAIKKKFNAFAFSLNLS